MAPICYPPHRVHADLTRALPPSAAQDLLAAFLAQTEKHAYLHPDAQLSTTSIDYAAQSGPSGGLVIHHLRRIAAGLRGENLAAETEEELKQFAKGGVGEESELNAGDDGHATKRAGGSSHKKRKGEEVEAWTEGASDAGGAGDERQWQDKEEYEREQEVLEGEVGERGGSDAEDVAVGAPAEKKVDKAARKAAKKAKLKEEKSKRKSGTHKDEDT